MARRRRRRRKGSGAPPARQQFEFEHGITDRLDVGFYNVFSQKPFEGLSYDGVKLRSRYRFGDPGELPLDPAIYAEVFYFNDEWGFEQRLILSKTVGKFEAHFNLKTEQEWKLHGPDKEMELIVNPSFGGGYHVQTWLAVGAEYFGRTALDDEKWGKFVYRRYAPLAATSRSSPHRLPRASAPASSAACPTTPAPGR